jgi:hypothetical protein
LFIGAANRNPAEIASPLFQAVEFRRLGVRSGAGPVLALFIAFINAKVSAAL